MALLTKTDWYNLSSKGWTVASTDLNTSTPTAEAQDPKGFLVAVTALSSVIQPTVDYVATASATVDGIKLGSVVTVDGVKVAIGTVTLTTAAGQAPTLNVSGSQVQDTALSGACTHTITSNSASPLFHAQDLGLFTVTNGQLQNSTFTWGGDVATATVDGVIKSSDLVGGRLTASGTIVGVDDNGAVATPTLTPSTYDGKAGVETEWTQTNPNGDYPTYSFTVTWPISDDD